MSLNQKNRWVIDNDLLHDLLAYGDGKPRVTGLEACWSTGHGFPIVKGVMTWLTMGALKFERLPWSPDWPFTFIHPEKKQLHAVLNFLNTNKACVDGACEELQLIYSHTQSFYKDSPILKLGRGYQDSESKRKNNLFGDYAKTVAHKKKRLSFLVRISSLYLMM